MEYIPEEFRRVFKTPWVKKWPQSMVGVISGVESPDFAKLVHQLVEYKYINQSHAIGSFFYHRIIANDQFVLKDIEIYNDMVDFYASRGDSHSVGLIFDKLNSLGIKPTVTTFNLLGKSYCRRTQLVLERLVIWDSLLKRMKKEGLVPNLVSWYLTLSLLPSNSDSKKQLQAQMKRLGLAQVPRFHDIVLTDMANGGSSAQQMLKYYQSLPRDSLDVNCMNSVIFKFMDENSFDKAWQFMRSESAKGLSPRNSTLTVLLRSCKAHDRLELMVRIINSMSAHYHLINYNANRMVLDYLMKLPDGQLPEWYPLVVKYMLRYDLSYGVDRHRRLDVLIKRLQIKLDNNFDTSIPLSVVKLSETTPFEQKLFENMRSLLVLENEQMEAQEKAYFAEPDSQDEVYTDTGEPDAWIENVVLKSYSDLMEQTLEAL